MKIDEINILQIEPTTYCNARCPHCARFDEFGNLHPDLTLGHLDVDAIEQNLELDKLINLKSVILEGDKGDPAMHPKIEKIIDIFSRAPSAPTVNLFTNGSIRNTEWWSKLAQKKYPNLNVVFSIDGLSDTNHLYRVGLNYTTIMDNVNAFIANGGHAQWKFILFKHNEHQFDEIVQLSKNLGFERFIYTTCRPGGFQGLSQWPVFVDGSQSHYIEPPTTNREGIINHISGTPVQQKHKINNTQICPNLINGQIYITYLNQVIPCCMMHFDTTLNYPGTKRLQELTQGFDNQDLTQHSLSTILGHPFFNHTLTESLKSGKWHINCARSCKSQIKQNLKYVQS